MISLRGVVVAGMALVASLVLFAASPAPVSAKIFQGPLPAPIEAIPVASEFHIVADPSCCPPPCITYKHHCTLKKTCCGCCEPIKVMLTVKDPCCCDKYVEIPICLPGCCKGEPSVCGKCGVLGRGVVTYDWCCGYKVRVVFDKCGDVTVHSYGR